MTLLSIFISNVMYAQKFKQIDQLIKTYENENQFSGSVLVAEKGNIIFEKSYGYRDAPKMKRNTNNSLYRIYSTTKIFTAIVILKLEEQGKLSLDDKISKYFSRLSEGRQYYNQKYVITYFRNSRSR